MKSLQSRSSHFRALINREGKLHVHGIRGPQNPLRDLYHFFLALSWPKFFLTIAFVYFATNLFFAVFYFYGGVDGHASGWQRFSRCFFLSIQNMTAVDYQKTAGAGLIVETLMAIQAFLGILTIAVITGLFYARFSKATARVIFSNKAIIATYNGKLCLSFRIANERLNRIAEAHMTLHMTRNETSLEGEHTRKFYDLKLERDHSLLFALSWTVRHFIDEKSPMFGMDEDKMHASEIGLVASLTGTDETFAQPIIARHAYSVDGIVFNKHFKDIIVWHEAKVHINLKGIHDFDEPILKAMGERS